MNTRQGKSVEELLRAPAELSDSELESFAEKYSPVSEEQKERIIDKGLEKLAAADKDNAGIRASENEITENVTVVRASEKRKISWSRIAAAAACISIAAGAVIFASGRTDKNNTVLNAPEVTEISAAFTAAEKNGNSEPAFVTQNVTDTAKETEKYIPAVTQVLPVTEISEITEAPASEAHADNSSSAEIQTPVTASENDSDVQKQQEVQEASENWIKEGTVLKFREGVKCITDEGFDGTLRSTVTKIIIPDGAEKIEELALSDFTALKELVIPDSVKTIGNYAFMNCHELREVELPSSLELLSTTIFNGCEIDKLVINSGSMICMNASETGSFYKDLHINSVVISEKAGRLADEFSLPVLNTSKLVLTADAAETLRGEMLYMARLGSVVIPEGTASLQNGAFNMVTVPEITIPASVKSIGEETFLNTDCRKITVLNPELELEGKLDSFEGTIAGYRGSTAEKYSENHGLKFDLTE